MCSTCCIYVYCSGEKSKSLFFQRCEDWRHLFRQRRRESLYEGQHRTVWAENKGISPHIQSEWQHVHAISVRLPGIGARAVSVTCVCFILLSRVPWLLTAWWLWMLLTGFIHRVFSLFSDTHRSSWQVRESVCFLMAQDSPLRFTPSESRKMLHLVRAHTKLWYSWI